MDDQIYDRLYSTDEIWFAQQTNRGLTSVIDDIFKVTDNLADNYAAKNHVHHEYATVDDVALKADAEHNHDEIYYKKSEVDEKLDALKEEIVELINQMHTADDNKSYAANEDFTTKKTETTTNSDNTKTETSGVDNSDDGA